MLSFTYPIRFYLGEGTKQSAFDTLLPPLKEHLEKLVKLSIEAKQFLEEATIDMISSRSSFEVHKK